MHRRAGLPGQDRLGLAERTQVSFALARQVTRDMARSGELVPAGTERAPHARRPMTVYVPAAREARPAGTVALESALRSWHAGVLTTG